MKKMVGVAASGVMVGSLVAAVADDVKAAAKKLADESNYSWKTTIVVPEGSSYGRRRPGPTEGKTEKDGYTWLSMKRGDTNVEAVLKSGKGAAKMEGEWRTLADMAQDDPGPTMFLARMLQNFRAPAAEAEDIAGRTKELKKDGDVLASVLTEDGAKTLLSFRAARSAGQGPPPAANAKGSVKFWLKDGQ